MTASDSSLKSLLASSKTIAVVGCSQNPEKPGNFVPAFLQSKGYRIIPINPNDLEILGEKCLKSVSELKQGIDIVSVFRPGEECEAIVKEGVKLKPKIVWLQEGIESKEAEKIVEIAGIPFVQNKCMMKEFKRLFP